MIFLSKATTFLLFLLISSCANEVYKIKIKNINIPAGEQIGFSYDNVRKKHFFSGTINKEFFHAQLKKHKNPINKQKLNFLLNKTQVSNVSAIYMIGNKNTQLECYVSHKKGSYYANGGSGICHNISKNYSFYVVIDEKPYPSDNIFEKNFIPSNEPAHLTYSRPQ